MSNDINSSTPLITGNEAKIYAMMLAGADLPSALSAGPKFANVNPRNTWTVYKLSASSTLTMDMCNQDCLGAFGSAGTSLLVPLNLFPYDDTLGIGLVCAIGQFGTGVLGVTFEGENNALSIGTNSASKIYRYRDPANLMPGEDPCMLVQWGPNTYSLL